MFYSKELGLQPGDQIVAFITPLGITKHFALYLGHDHEGNEWVIENQKLAGVRLVKASDHFRNVIKIDRIQKFPGGNAARKQVVQNALSKLGKAYNLINYNCKHFITDITTGSVESRQVKNAVILLLALLFLKTIID